MTFFALRSTFYVDVIGKKNISKSYIHCKYCIEIDKIIDREKYQRKKKVLKKEKAYM